ncbi:ATP-binding protein [Leptospira sp. 2 VSF19]|uniref:histidine kinase n=1 Tax=Leptospira soteropolitanensis TaxID=2950025 RepID=A0AAW5VIM2_9LEPT|nr:response regulator [Leptospira soteropolitanensis]MCW7493623.1 ATP-binding protein [Leptospira soteropolitanensis]MCW7501222.1 ATP-binding protein [Leptospira soteropolitanensis]MCW7523592.1 ATP-binding protein [Leptospira soteropolitanensis]MCW7527335.1 ATP-binding protein [Leptospira soteropolitanensis]MCW7531192.1 ATP-binding protein [Leptospira soteropolitanensis]
MKYFLRKHFESFYLGFLWGLLGLLFCSSFFFFYQIYESRIDRINFEEKTLWNSILSDYASYLKDAETGVRGYLLTEGNPDFLEPYRKSLNQMMIAEKFLSKNCEPSYQKDLESIIHSKQSKLVWIQNFIENFPTKRPQIKEFLESKRRMDVFRSEVQSLLKKKSEKENFEREQSREYTIRLISLSGGLFFILSIFIIWMIFVLKRNAQIILEKELIEDRLFEIDDLYQNSPVGFHSLDSKGYLVKINKTQREWLGYSEEELLGKVKWPDLLTEESREVFFQNFVIFKKTGQVDNLRFEVIRKDGRSLFLNVSATAIYGKNNEMLQSRSVSLDISQMVLYERELIESRVRAEEANRAKSEFLSNMSHELRTPLNAVIGLSLWLMEDNPKPEQVDYLKNLRFSSETLLTLINDILDFNKIEERMIVIEEIDFNLKDLIGSVSSSFEIKAKEQLLEFQTEVDSNLPEYICFDPTRLLQVLNNLLSNAIKFTKEGKIILRVILVSQTENHVVIRFEVEDTGIGIGPDKLKFVFEKFTQASGDTTRKYGGSGLGLAISKGLAELMQGNLELESELGKGSKFSFTFPCKIGKTNSLRKNHSLKVSSDLSGKRVLIADDIEINRSIVIRFLKRWGIECEEASDGEEVLSKLVNEKFDLILMDLHMPNMDGYMTTKRIRANSLWSKIPIIALTASAQLETQDKIHAVGMNDFISKPFYPNELHKKLTHWISK